VLLASCRRSSGSLSPTAGLNTLDICGRKQTHEKRVGRAKRLEERTQTELAVAQTESAVFASPAVRAAHWSNAGPQSVLNASETSVITVSGSSSPKPGASSTNKGVVANRVYGSCNPLNNRGQQRSQADKNENLLVNGQSCDIQF
jgi:hypothetical protein